MFDHMQMIVGSCDLSHAHFHGKLFVRQYKAAYQI